MRDLTDIISDLSLSKRTFLYLHQIRVYDLIDVSGIEKSQYQEFMEINNKSFALGATSCGANEDHEFIDRYDHCLQCRPSNIAYLRRFDDKGYVYVAGSMELKCHKIGCSHNPRRRIERLNTDKYGGTNDWEWVAHFETKKMGRQEDDLHKKLSRFKIVKEYQKGDGIIKSRELFRCKYSVIRNSLLDNLLPNELQTLWERRYHLDAYEFTINEW